MCCCSTYIHLPQVEAEALALQLQEQQAAATAVTQAASQRIGEATVEAARLSSQLSSVQQEAADAQERLVALSAEHSIEQSALAEVKDVLGRKEQEVRQLREELASAQVGMVVAHAHVPGVLQ